MKFSILAQVAYVVAYGQIGHSLSGSIAQDLLTPKAKVFLKDLIPEFEGNLAKAANWGDTIKSNHDYDWAKPLHYINPVHDDPPSVCVYNPGKEDCPGDICVVQAIRNYTARLQNPNVNRNEALKFLIHFIGDLHQPLHTTGRARGGTQAQVRFEGRTTNMHTVWDSLMFQKRIKQDFKGASTLYSDYLVKSIGTTWRAEVNEWLSCPSSNIDNKSQVVLQDRKAMMIEQLVCPEVWAKYNNKVNCVSVWPGYKRKFELSGQYYESNIKVEEKMLAQAAVRMAAILNAIAEF